MFPADGGIRGKGMISGDIYLKKVNVKGKQIIFKGTVIKVYPKFFLVDFGCYKESFSNIRDKEK